MSIDLNKLTVGTSEILLHSLLRTLGRLRQAMEPYFARHGISVSQWGVLRVLQRAEAQGERMLRLRDLGEQLLIQPPSVTGVVDRLERLGLVARNGSSDDLRVRLVSLTPVGRALVAKVLVAHDEQIKSLFSGLAEELQSLPGLLKGLETRLGTQIQSAGD